jgi:hypothetical protein
MSVLEQFVSRLRALGHRRVDLETLQAVYQEIDPATAFSPRRRQALLDLLREAEAAGALSLAKGRPDRRALPELPSSVMLAERPTEAPRRVARSDAFFRPELAWAAELRLTPEELTLLRSIDAFLRDVSSDEPVVPIRERSLELFGEEKRLDSLLSSRLFTPARLSLALLRCQRVHPPFVWTRVGDAPRLLVVENHQTYYSLAQVLADCPSSGVGVLAYGAGNHIVASITYAVDLPIVVEDIRYFGDLDHNGLVIPAHASRVAVEAGLPPVQPATGLYADLLRVGHTGRCASLSRDQAEQAAAWLDAEQREAVVDLLGSGRRIAQEWLGHKSLTASSVARQLRIA